MTVPQLRRELKREMDRRFKRVDRRFERLERLIHAQGEQIRTEAERTRGYFEDTRRHFDVVAESWEDKLKKVLDPPLHHVRVLQEHENRIADIEHGTRA